MLLTMALGIVLSRKGTPYKTSIFTIHKLSALAGLVTYTILIIHLYKCAQIQSFQIASTVLAGVSAAALLVTGALLNVKKLHKLLKAVHIAATVILFVTLFLTTYLAWNNC